MSFAGHVFDMIKRDKQNREMLTYHRKRMKENQLKAYAKKTSNPNTNISLEMLERIIKKKEKRESEEERRFFFTKILLFALVLIVLLLILGIRYIIRAC